jgi:predicted metal-binding membrane protein
MRPESAGAGALREAALDVLLRRDRLVVVGALAALTVAAWLYLVHLASAMSHMAMPDMPGMAMTMPAMHAWSWVELGALVVMWSVMMVAMMVPSAAPMILMFAAINRRRREQPGPLVPTAAFVAGYLLVWTGFSVLASLAQWGLHAAALLSPMMVSTSPWLGGVLLMAAGIFQWSPLKEACLSGCRSPMSFIMTRWRPGRGGALRMGLEHGAYCLGCCWLLMAMLFVAGVMNLLWIAAIAAFVLLEKVVPRGKLVGRVAGVVLAGAGGLLLARAVLG